MFGEWLNHEWNRTVNAPVILALCLSLGLLSACGGSNDVVGGQRSPSGVPDSAPHTAIFSQSDDGDYLGLGPAFLGQSPQKSDLPESSETTRNDVTIRSGMWRDPQGRDGSRSASEVVRYIKAYLSEIRKTSPDEELVVIDFGPSKTLRVYGASENEKDLVQRAIQEINTALPYGMRIKIGSDLTAISSHDNVPDGEIHLSFTKGRSSWPGNNSSDDKVLGLGATLVTDENVVRGGIAYIDKNQDEGNKHFVIIHELLHAYGLGAHVDPNLYPYSVMTPTIHNGRRPVYLSIDGEGLLAETRIAKGTKVSELTVGALGNWTDTGFHLMGVLNLDGLSAIEFGAGYRNGLSKPWAYGPRPQSTIKNNPDFLNQPSATWNGALLGFTEAGKSVAGDAQIAINFGPRTGRAYFNNLEYWDAKARGKVGKTGTGTQWEDGDLGYTIRIMTQGSNDEGFISTSALGDDLGVVSGLFVGRRHEGATGILEHPDLSAGFGAKR